MVRKGGFTTEDTGEHRGTSRLGAACCSPHSPYLSFLSHAAELCTVKDIILILQ